MKKILIFTFCGFLLLGCTNNSTKKPVYNAKKLIPDIETIKIAQDIKKYQGQSLKLPAKVLNDPQVTNNNVTMEVQANPKEQTIQHFIVKTTTNMGTFKKNDYLVIEGLINGLVEKKPVIETKKIIKSSYIELVAPTIKELSINQTQTNKTISITVDKVEFATNQTRVYLSIKNNTKEVIAFYRHKVKASLNSNLEYDQLGSEDNNYANLVKTTIIAHQATSGVVILKPIDYKVSSIINLHFEILLPSSGTLIYDFSATLK